MKLYEHQQKALDLTKDHTSCAYYLDMGLGKTYVGSRKMMELDKRVNLIICQKSKIDDWIDHFSEYDNTYWNYNLIYDLTDKNGLKAFLDVVADTSYTQRIIGVINYDLVWRRPVLKKIDIGTLMLDESQNIQNKQNKRSKFIMRMDADNVILLSGTPTNGKYENLWSQLHMIGWNIAEDVYLNTYVDYEWLQNDDGFWFKKIQGYKNVDRLKRKMSEHGVVFMKTDECFDLPEQRDVIIKVNPSDDYKFFMKNDMVTLEDGTELVGDTILTKFLRARQLCGQYSKDKLEAFEELISSTEERLIVFYNFVAELDHLIPIAALLGKSVSFVNGQYKDLSAYENDENSITFIQFQAGATGLNLQKAHIMIYYSLPFGKGSCAMWEQSKKRIHRIGQKNNCIYYYLLCKDTIEPLNLTQLQIGKEYNDELFKKEVTECQQVCK